MSEHLVEKKDIGRRIDQFLLDILSNITRSTSKALVMDGSILVNNERVRSNYRLKENDSIKIFEEKVNLFLNKEPHYSIKPVKMDLEIIFEDEFTLVVNKPANLTTHPVPGHREDTLLNGLIWEQMQKKESESAKIRPVHRLDKDTSGVILFAKTRDAHVYYSEQFENHRVEKTYLAVVKGNFKKFLGDRDRIVLQNYLMRSSRDRKKMVEVSAQEGALAISNLYFENTWGGLNGDYSVVKIIPKTGKTHQIRVHLAGLGFPIVGDVLYSQIPYKRLMLHSTRLTLKKFGTNEEVTFEANPPKEFRI